MNLFLPSPFWSHNIPLQVSSAAQHGPASHQHGPSFLPSQKMPLQVETSGNVVVVVVGFVVVALVVCHHQNRRCRSPPPPPLLLLVGGERKAVAGLGGVRSVHQRNELQHNQQGERKHGTCRVHMHREAVVLLLRFLHSPPRSC